MFVPSRRFLSPSTSDEIPLTDVTDPKKSLTGKRKGKFLQGEKVEGTEESNSQIGTEKDRKGLGFGEMMSEKQIDDLGERERERAEQKMRIKSAI